MMGRTAQVPYPIVQAEAFLPAINQKGPFRREWINQLGDVCALEASGIPNHYDLVNLLVFLHVVQQSKEIEKTVIDEDRYKVVMPLSLMYSILGIKDIKQRRDLWESLKKLSKIVLEIKYKKPWNHNGVSEIVFFGLTGDLKLIKQRGRTGTILEAKPLRAMVDDRMLTVDVARMVALKSALARITAFFLACRPTTGVVKTWKEWMECVSTGKSEKRFKELFKKALEELGTVGYVVEDRGGSVKIQRPKAR